MNALSNLLDGMILAWPNAVVCAAIFVALLYHPQRISNRLAFKLGCVLFVFSLMMPAMMAFLPTYSVQSLPVRQASNNGAWLIKAAGLLQPLVFATAFLSLVWSLLPPTGASNE